MIYSFYFATDVSCVRVCGMLREAEEDLERQAKVCFVAGWREG